MIVAASVHTDRQYDGSHAWAERPEREANRVAFDKDRSHDLDAADVVQGVTC
jgi:hypothetical protein